MTAEKVTYFSSSGVYNQAPFFGFPVQESWSTSEKIRVNYTPFGVTLKGRNLKKTGLADEFRFGFNGMEADDEMKGDGNSYDFGARIHDSRLGRFLSLDDYQRISVNVSLYSFSANDPISLKEYYGNFKYPAGSNYESTYPVLTHYLKNNIQDILNNPKVLNAFMKYGQFTKEQVAELVKWGSGPTIQIDENTGDMLGNYGYFEPTPGSSVLHLNKSKIRKLERALGANEKRKWLFIIGVTILHETVHYGDNKDGVDYDATDVDPSGEEGNAFEIKAYGQVINEENAGEYLSDKDESYNPNIQRAGRIVFDSNKAVKREDGNLNVKDLVSGSKYVVKRNQNGTYTKVQ